jgi:hypothetical protein
VIIPHEVVRIDRVSWATAACGRSGRRDTGPPEAHGMLGSAT